MGWTSYHATNYTNKGTVDRKAECDDYFTNSMNEGRYIIKKSVLVGATYYAAIETVKRTNKDTKQLEVIPENERETWAAVLLTEVSNNDYYNFSYKDMSEDMGPLIYTCPASILNLLTPTACEYAIKWRAKCREYIEKKNSPNALSKLPIGAIIRFERRGREYIIEKMAPNYQFKRAWWYIPANNCYMPSTRIPSNYEVVTA